jgi:hypothetical protein
MYRIEGYSHHQSFPTLEYHYLPLETIVVQSHYVYSSSIVIVYSIPNLVVYKVAEDRPQVLWKLFVDVLVR